MEQTHFEKLDLRGAYLIHNNIFCDNRGSFTKYYEATIFQDNGIDFRVDESFVTVSARNVVRGLHFQDEKPQAKLVTVLKGKVWDVIVDLREDSETYLQWRGFELSEKNGLSLYIPQGFAHGFVALENDTIMLYQCHGQYLKEHDTGIIYHDKTLNISWPLKAVDIICSERDLKLQTLEQYLQYCSVRFDAEILD